MARRRVEKKEQVRAELKTEAQEKGVNEGVDHLDRTAQNVL